MSDLLISILLGVVEGVTEFLPISSTGHLRIAQHLLGVDLTDGYWKMYAVMIQLGAILSLPVYFRSRILKFCSTFPRGEDGRRNVFTHPLTLVMIAFVVTAAPAALLKRQISANLESMTIIGLALLVGGIIMWIVDVLFGRRYREAKDPAIGEAPAPSEVRPLPDPQQQGLVSWANTTTRMEEMRPWQAVVIGAAQVFSALFPGASRSMTTIAAGQVAGLSRPAALEFSFFLSMPTMAAACLYDFYNTVRPGADAVDALEMTPHQWLVLAVGFVVSFVVALAVVAWFMNWVRRHGFVPFAIYRIILAAIVLLAFR